MSEATAAAGPRFRRLWHPTLPGLRCWISSAVLGALVWGCEGYWYLGALAAISLWIIVGLLAQVHDLGKCGKQCVDLPSEERWGWRFAVAWRLVVACLMGACIVVHALISLHVPLLDDGYHAIFISAGQLCHALLLTTIILAIASSPRLVHRRAPHRWSWVIELLRFIVAVLLVMIVAMDHTLTAALVHTTIALIGLAQPNHFSEGFASANPAQLAHLLAVATAGAVSVLVACGLLRLLSRRWWRGRGQRACWGTLLAASLAAMIAIAGQIGRVEIPRISPILAAQITVPGFGLLALAAALVLLLVMAAARRWSEPLSTDSATESLRWRRDERRYHHERRPVIVLLAAVTFLPVLRALLDFSGRSSWEWMTW
jgi:hypothetical protein